jgi:hypothetical protein
MRFLFLLLLAFQAAGYSQAEKRNVLSLNGQWDIAFTGLNGQMPEKYNNKIQVPGLVDMAVPGLVKANKRTDDTLFWYRRTFWMGDVNYDIAELNILRARYHTWVYINGRLAGENPYNFTASTYDIRKYLKKNSENEIVIKTGCYNNVPDSIIDGTDVEIFYYMPGIYDDVFINLTHYPFITNLQTAPDIDKEELRVVARIKTKGNEAPKQLSYQVKELKSNRIIASGTLNDMAVSRDGEEWKVDFMINMKGSTLWSPENPFLYDLTVSTGADVKSTRVGMRTFRFDTPTGMGILNNKPYFMRGTNVDLNRFFEDTARQSLPWNKVWVTNLYAGFKNNYWNALRNTTFFPPEFWYDICDSIGILVFDEYDIWDMVGKPEMMTQSADQIAREYVVWMRERWNHPSVIVWDAQNETVTQQTGEAINKVRHLDIQNRPWDNGFAAPASDGDCKEVHPYTYIEFVYPNAKLPAEGIMKYTYERERWPENGPDQWTPSPSGKRYPNATVINEYGWLWLNRDGSTTKLTDNVYSQLFGPNLTNSQRLEIYARHLGMKTEFWRETRKNAAVLHYAALNCSRNEEPRGSTSDNFIDVKNLIYEPSFIKYALPAFCPAGIMIKYFETSLPVNETITVPVSIINDTYQTYTSEMKLYFRENGDNSKNGNELIMPVEVRMNGKQIYECKIITPSKAGKYDLIAEIMYDGKPIRSYRQIELH